MKGVSDMFEEIKQAVSMRAAAERYGLNINRGCFARCPFHSEKTASLKIYEDSFYCFGCGVGGDVISFAARLHGLNNAQAALRINEDFGLFLTQKKPAAKSEYLSRKREQEKKDKAFRRDHLAKCSEFRSLNEEMKTAQGFRKAEITARLEYLDYYFENTEWR